MALRCKGCGSEEHVKNGFMRGKQRYRCRACGLNFTDTPPRGMPLRIKVTAVLLYLSGLSMNRKRRLSQDSQGSTVARQPLGLPRPRQQPFELVGLGPTRDHPLEHV